ncbi:LOW QUALITY PROTEIN: syncollin [Aegotheles albertisi]
MWALVALVAAAVALGGVEAQCPAPSDLRQPNSTRLCAELYADNSPYYDQCCAGAVLVVEPGADVPYMRGWSPLSSLVVGTRCELTHLLLVVAPLRVTVWSRSAKRGTTKRFKACGAGLQEVKRGLFGNWNDEISGYYCTCS